MSHETQLQEILRASGLSQEALAARLGVSFPTVNAWLNRRSTPRQKAISEIEALYAELVGGKAIDADELSALMSQAESRRLTIRELTTDHLLLDQLTLALTFHTDAIEGSTMTMSDTKAVLFDGKTLQNRTLVEQMEAKNHQAALWWLVDEMNTPGFEIDEDLILDLHARLMNGIMSDAGRYRRHGVRIASTRVTVTNYLRVPELLGELCATRPRKGEPTIAFMARHHASFEQIHPFGDGNGRIGRLLLLVIALQQKMVPPIIVRERRALYYRALEAAQTNDDLLILQKLLAESVISSDDDIVRRSN